MPRRLIAVCAALAAAGSFLFGAAPAPAMTIERVLSPGGIEAWLVEDHSLPVVALSLAFRGAAALDPADRSGLATMVSGLLDEGAGPLDSAAFQKRLSDLAIDLGFDAGQDEFRGTMPSRSSGSAASSSPCWQATPRIRARSRATPSGTPCSPITPMGAIRPARPKA
jgi:hypothetical protein